MDVRQVVDQRVRHGVDVDVHERSGAGHAYRGYRSTGRVSHRHPRAYPREAQAPRSLQAVRPKLAALSSVFHYLCERNAASLNPVAGVTRPEGNSHEDSPTFKVTY